MKKLFFLFVLFFSVISVYANIGEVNDAPSSFVWSGDIGGLYLPSESTINVLFIFAQFPDDSYEINNPSWPKGGLPSNYNTWVDQTWISNATPYSMTDYFNQMSLTPSGGTYISKLKFTGKKVSVTTPHSRQWYLDNNKIYSDINKEIIQQLDATWDFGEFDNWHYNSNYNHTNNPDGTVEMIIVIYRNISSEFRVILSI